MSDWRPNIGRREDPRDPAVMVDIRLRCGWEVHCIRAGDYNWKDRGTAGDIVFARKTEGPTNGPVPNWR